MSIPVKDCPLHGLQKVYIVCTHLLSRVRDRYARNSEPIATILPPREGWHGFIMCKEVVHDPNKIHAVCERCCMEQNLLTINQLGKAYHLTEEKI